MKKTTMKALAAAAAVLLIAAVFVGAGAAAESANLSIDTEKLGAGNIWPMSGVTGEYWTKNTSTVVIPILVNTSGASKYLYAYDITFAGNMTTDLLAAPTAANFQNAVPAWTGGSFANKSWHIAKTGDAAGDNKLDISTSKQLVNITFGPTVLSGKEGGVYILTATGNLGATSAEFASVTVDDITSIPVTSAYFPKDSQFILHIRGSTESNPKTTSYVIGKFPGEIYPTLTSGNPGTTFYYFIERMSGESKVVNITAITSPKYNNDFDTNKWETSGTTLTGIQDTVLADSDGKLNNWVTVSPTAGSSTLNLTLNKGKGTDIEDVTSFKFNTTKWLISNTTNAGSRSAYSGDSEWNFDTKLNRTYVVSAGPVNVTEAANGWDSYVKFENMTRGTLDAAWNASVAYTLSSGTGNFYLNSSDTKSNHIISGGNFTVTTNAVADGSKTVTVVLTGYKLGDANMDNSVNIADSAVIGIYVLKSDDSAKANAFLDAEHRLYADCDKTGAGVVDVADILAVNKYIVGNNPWA